MTGKQKGSTLLGLVIGALVGLAIALAVAVYISKMPVPFTNKTSVHNSESDAAETMKNRNWNPNAPLAGKNALKATPSVSGGLSNPNESEPPAAAVPDPTRLPAPAAKAPKAATAASAAESAKLSKIWSLEPLGDLAKPATSAAKSAKPGSPDLIGDLAKARSADPLGDLVKARSAAPLSDLAKPPPSPDVAADRLEKAGSTDLLGELAQARSTSKAAPVEAVKPAVTPASAKPAKTASAAAPGDAAKTTRPAAVPGDAAKIRTGEVAKVRLVTPVPDASSADAFQYFVQGGAFKTLEDAEKQRTKLQTLTGTQARVSGREQGAQTVYRVRLGPFKKKDDADKVRSKLDDHAIETTMVKRAAKVVPRPAG